MTHVSHHCMHMDAREYANETRQIFRRKFKFDYFHKTTQPFLMRFEEIISKLKL